MTRPDDRYLDPSYHEDREPDADWERLEEIRDRIVANREFFAMRNFFTDARGFRVHNLVARNAPQTSAAGEAEWCGTSCCVAGFAVTMYPSDLRQEVEEGKFAFLGDPSNTGECAAELLGLTYGRAYIIFAGFVDYDYIVRDDDGGVLYTVSPRWADGQTSEDLTLLYIDALLKRRAFVYPHECAELREIVRFVNVHGEEL